MAHQDVAMTRRAQARADENCEEEYIVQRARRESEGATRLSLYHWVDEGWKLVGDEYVQDADIVLAGDPMLPLISAVYRMVDAHLEKEDNDS